MVPGYVMYLKNTPSLPPYNNDTVYQYCQQYQPYQVQGNAPLERLTLPASEQSKAINTPLKGQNNGQQNWTNQNPYQPQQQGFTPQNDGYENPHQYGFNDRQFVPLWDTAMGNYPRYNNQGYWNPQPVYFINQTEQNCVQEFYEPDYQFNYSENGLELNINSEVNRPNKYEKGIENLLKSLKEDKVAILATVNFIKAEVNSTHACSGCECSFELRNKLHQHIQKVSHQLKKVKKLKSDVIIWSNMTEGGEPNSTAFHP